MWRWPAQEMWHEPHPLKFGQCRKITKLRKSRTSTGTRCASKRHERIQQCAKIWAPPVATWSGMACFQPAPPGEEFQGSDWTPPKKLQMVPKMATTLLAWMASLLLPSGAWLILFYMMQYLFVVFYVFVAWHRLGSSEPHKFHTKTAIECRRGKEIFKLFRNSGTLPW